MTNKTDVDDAFLDGFFDAAKHDAPIPSAQLTAAVLADAEAMQPAPAGQRAPARRRRLASILAVLGGWPAVAGLASTACIGLWIGVNPPQSLVGSASYLWGSDSDYYLVDTIPDFTADLEAG